MKIKNLYIKIFLSFIFLLLISEVLIFGVFHILFEKQADIEANHELKKYFTETVFLFREVVEEKIRSRPNLPVNENPELRKTICRLSEKYNLIIWMEIPGSGRINFTGEKIPEISNEKLINSGNFFYKIHMGKKGSVYVKIPVMLHAGDKGFINVLHRREPIFHRIPFIRGLLVIGICIALLLYPFSRLITQPLKKLTKSVDTFAKGDLSHRVFIKTRYEIGRLAESFNKMAAKIESMINGTKEMTANISHELRSPLARMRIAKEMLSEKLNSNNKDFNKYLNSIENEIEEMDLLLGQVLNLTKLDIKEKEKKEDVDVGNLITEIIKSYDTVFEKKSINISFRKPDNTLLVPAVKEDMKTVFYNVIDNASKYTNANGEITIELYKTDENINAVISNTCDNLREDELLNLTRPFYRSSADNTIPGYGLGLAITKKILDNCGGNIALQNTDKGLTVDIVIPILHE